MAPPTPTYSAEELARRQQMLDIAREELNLEKEKLKTLTEGTTAYEDQKNLIFVTAELIKAQADDVRDVVNSRKSESALILEEIKRLETYKDQIDSIGSSRNSNLLKQETSLEISKETIKYLEDQLKLHGSLTAAQEKELQNEQKKIEKTDKLIGRFKKIEEQLKNGIKRNDKFSQGFDKIKDTVLDIITAFKMGPKAGFQFIAMKGAAAIDSILLGAIQKGVSLLFNTFKKLLFQMDEVTKAFEKQTAMGDRFNQGMLDSFYALRSANIGMEKLSQATVTLIKNTSDFTLINTQTANQLRDTGAVLAELGISLDDYSNGLQNSMKMFGMTAEQAEHQSRRLFSMAQELRVAPQDLAADYARVGTSLAKLGRDGPRAFQELARTSKLTGLEIEKILNLTDKFDTFESAAEMTGKLNAALGGNFVNAMDMMMDTDPVSRFEKMRDAISSTGLTFDEMSYYQRQFFTEAMGLSDVGDLALMMSGNMDMMSGAQQQSAADYVDLAARAEENLNMQERFQALLLEMAPTLMDLAEKLHEFLKELSNNEQMLQDVSAAARKFVDFGIWVTTNMGSIITWLGILRLAFMGIALAAGSASIAFAGPVGFIAAIGAVGYAIFSESNSPTFFEGIKKGGLVSTGLNEMGRSALNAGRDLRASGADIATYSREVNSATTAANESANSMAQLEGSMSNLSANQGLSALSSFASADITMLEKLREVFVGIADALKSIPSEQSTALSATVDTLMVASNEIPTQNARQLTDTLNATNTAAVSLRSIPYAPAAAAAAPTRSPSPTNSGTTEVATLNLKFDSELFEDRVVRLSRNEAGKIVVEAVQQAT